MLGAGAERWSGAGRTRIQGRSQAQALKAATVLRPGCALPHSETALEGRSL